MHAYFSGNAGLCDALIRNGAHPNTMNKQGVTIFNAPVATKQLLFRILSMCSFLYDLYNSCNVIMYFNIKQVSISHYFTLYLS